MSKKEKALKTMNSNLNSFSRRHIGIDQKVSAEMLKDIGFSSMDDFIQSIVPKNIYSPESLNLSSELSEEEALRYLEKISKKNKVYKTYIGQGFYNSVTPAPIIRNIFENPGWYTSYTPYQPEIAQGRLEALINYQTMICDLTGMEIANASLLDEPTAAAEAMTLAKRISKSKASLFIVDEQCLPQTINVLKTRAKPLGIEIKIGDPQKMQDEEYFAALVQYPGVDGVIRDFSDLVDSSHKNDALVIFAADILALTLIKPPGEFGADIVIGSSQRFGVPIGFGGPHAAFMATKESYKRSLPGRIVGASIDSHGNIAYRLALQTREQHIRREKATSNICTAQALLAIMAGFYAVYHGSEGLKAIGQRVNDFARLLMLALTKNDINFKSSTFFDTLVILSGDKTHGYIEKALDKKINLRLIDDSSIGITIDESVSFEDLKEIVSIFCDEDISALNNFSTSIPENLIRTSNYLTHSVFNDYQTETELMRYIRRLFNKDIALDTAMIPLGSCTMKLNSASEMMPVSWPEFSSIHPLVPANQIDGYTELTDELESMLIAITGYKGVSLQPNAGSQGEFAGLLAINAYHKSKGDCERNICLIPRSAHGTNPASAQMVGLEVVPIECNLEGNISIKDLKEKTELYKDKLSAIMITYPSTHGVFESSVTEVCKIVHDAGGLVYIDGANLNAMVGLCYPGHFGGDVSHLNLHKTFCIPHGGGGPGVGPIGVVDKLKEFVPGFHNNSSRKVGPVSGSDWGSASILPISWMYIKMMGANGLRKATEIAILNANYIAFRLKDDYQILYKGESGLVAHECILDVRPFKDSAEVEVEDIAKRLIDYGFHAPTMSWPVAGTLMIEPTESESRAELDRFCDAMISIRKEISDIETGALDKNDNMLKNAPHTAEEMADDEWTHSYSRIRAAYPVKSLKNNKFWPPVGRVDNTYGDRNLICSCPSMDDF
ncbi:MAG: aminomethyl-transferring glycine dehydrogenase [SAR86 cluster bacterium]|uniref:Glycine dehydrogenase (decarboxylating) n=1 Tax=SAR86 cluster bacterium TaxID=2030880 RepID=A0A937JDN4_9GAMM|nr:aminomethyl-transferring glycine dehydrogenase [SAR86 cluster bacterium]